MLTNPMAGDNPEGRTCKVQPNGSRSYQIGQPHGAGTIADGTDGVELACTVTESGQLSVDLGAQNQAVGLPGVFGMTFDGVIGSTTDRTQNSATLAFFDSEAGNLLTEASGPLCTFSAADGATTITHLPGALLAAFTCPLLAAPDAVNDGCRATGTIALEYCETR